MQVLISNGLLIVVTGGIGYLIAQWRPTLFENLVQRGMMMVGWIVVLLLAAALRAAAVVYGPEAMLFVLSAVGGFALGAWLGQRERAQMR
jgi:hypothetical protein